MMIEISAVGTAESAFCVVQISDHAMAAHLEATPDHRANAQQHHLQLIDDRERGIRH